MIDGVAHKVQARFRAYASPEASFRDYASLISNSPRYAGVVDAGSDAKAFAQGLQRAGYATDPAYADTVKELKAEILRLQAEVKETMPPPRFAFGNKAFEGEVNPPEQPKGKGAGKKKGGAKKAE